MKEKKMGIREKLYLTFVNLWEAFFIQRYMEVPRATANTTAHKIINEKQLWNSWSIYGTVEASMEQRKMVDWSWVYEARRTKIEGKEEEMKTWTQRIVALGIKRGKTIREMKEWLRDQEWKKNS